MKRSINLKIKSMFKWKEKFIEDNFYRPRWYSIFFSPYFIIRYSLYKNIAKFAKGLNGCKKILDVGCGLKPYESLFFTHEYIGIDVESGYWSEVDKKTNTYFDGINIPFDNNSFDVVLCTEVLEHASDPDKLLKEIFRVLKDDGILYLTVPFVWNEHEVPYDFRRFTQYGIKKMLNDNKIVSEQVIPTSGFFGILGQLICASIFESIPFRSSSLKLILSLLIFSPIQIIAIIFDKIFKSKWMTLGYVVIAHK